MRLCCRVSKMVRLGKIGLHSRFCMTFTLNFDLRKERAREKTTRKRHMRKKRVKREHVRMAGTMAQSKAERADKIRRIQERRMAVLKSGWEPRKRPLSKKDLKRLALTRADLQETVRRAAETANT